jgi:hypothetical protein
MRRHPVTKITRIRFAHDPPPIIVNHIQAQKGIPIPA